jgi:hypothetical protein
LSARPGMDKPVHQEVRGLLVEAFIARPRLSGLAEPLPRRRQPGVERRLGRPANPPSPIKGEGPPQGGKMKRGVALPAPTPAQRAGATPHHEGP